VSFTNIFNSLSSLF